MLRPIDIRWTHLGTQVFAIHDDYTIWNHAITNRHSAKPYSVYQQIEGDEVHLASYVSLQEAIDHINEGVTV